MKYQERCKGTCSMLVNFEIDEDVVKNVEFMGGCHGNLQGIASLVEGMKAEEIIKRLKGIDCGGKGTSCPDQLAKALERVIKNGEA